MNSNEKNLDNSLESTMSMTQEEIERFLSEQENLGSSEQYGFNDADLASLLSELGEEEDKDIQEITNLLNRADNNEAVADDVVNLLKRHEAEGENAYDAMDLFSGEQSEKKEGFFKRLLNKFKGKKKEQSKENSQEQEETAPEWENIKEENATDNNMAEALALLNGEAEDIDEKQKEKNQGNTKKEKSSKKKEKKAKKTKKEKKSAGKDSDNSKSEQIPEKSNKKKKGKEKPVKEKKGKDESIREKKPVEDVVEILEEEEQETPHKKKIIMVFVAAVMIMAGFLIVNHYFTRHANKKLAEEAYEKEEYLECYQLLYGQKLNDSQTAMFHRSELILKMEIFWNHYQEFVINNQLLESLDRLVQFVYDYPELLSYATEWNCQETVESTYSVVVTILAEEYKLNEQEALDIAFIEDDVDYTRELADLVEMKKENDAIEQAYPDILQPEYDRITQK